MPRIYGSIRKLALFILTLCWLSGGVLATHFRGGIIMIRPVNGDAPAEVTIFNSNVQIIICIQLKRRRFHTVVQIFKSIATSDFPQLPIYIKKFQFSRDVTGHVSRKFNRLFVPRVSTKLYYGIASLSSIVSEATTVPSFKNLYFNSD